MEDLMGTKNSDQRVQRRKTAVTLNNAINLTIHTVARGIKLHLQHIPHNYRHNKRGNNAVRRPKHENSPKETKIRARYVVVYDMMR